MKNLTKISIAGLFLVLSGFVFQNCNTTKNITDRTEDRNLSSKLTGVWFLASIKGTKATDAFKELVPTLIFDFEKSEVSGNGGCNQYNGKFSLSGNVYAPAPMVSTLKACIKENQESELLELLSKKSTLQFNNYTLQFVQNNTVVLEFTPKAR
ncbi:MAG: META domain-containing protein [Flavobacteriaceae bacterium]|nr:META domain-containing protein [Flavobacteriaceae bacterium]